MFSTNAGLRTAFDVPRCLDVTSLIHFWELGVSEWTVRRVSACCAVARLRKQSSVDDMCQFTNG